MDIQALSTDMAQSRVLEQASVMVLSKSLEGSQENAAAILKILGSVKTLPDESGSRVNELA
jgi:hypothetical protein